MSLIFYDENRFLTFVYEFSVYLCMRILFCSMNCPNKKVNPFPRRETPEERKEKKNIKTAKVNDVTIPVLIKQDKKNQFLMVKVLKIGFPVQIRPNNIH